MTASQFLNCQVFDKGINREEDAQRAVEAAGELLDRYGVHTAETIGEIFAAYVAKCNDEPHHVGMAQLWELAAKVARVEAKKDWLVRDGYATVELSPTI